MKTVLHKADSRGYANHTWLKTHHSFSFANYYDPQRMNFGVLRVLNDDIIAGRMGFGKHPHDNMEIISVALSGELEHKDSMGNVQVIRPNEIQVMSAGSGIFHSEYNRSNDLTSLLQIWVFPNKQNVTPRYDQQFFEPKDRKNTLQQILSPNADNAGVWIHQNAWFHWGDLDKNFQTEYTFKDPKNNGLYVFVIEGEIEINGQNLQKRDGFGIWDTEKVQVVSKENAFVLFMEVPMEF